VVNLCWGWMQRNRVKKARRLGKSRSYPRVVVRTAHSCASPLVSILIPAYNAHEWIAESLHSAVEQTWHRKEIIVVDDGSTDRTVEVARRFESAEVKIVRQENQGAAAARNHALRLSQGDYIQWLDADDVLAPDKIERQLEAFGRGENRRKLLSSPWAYFYYRTRRAQFVPTSLWQNLSPVDWLLKKLGENLHMQPATWLTSRELIQAAGPWDTRLITDDDGEYFCRVLCASQGTVFVPDSRVFYRIVSAQRWSYVGNSDKRKNALLLSMKLHINCLRAMEDSDRVKEACLSYLQNWYDNFYPERPDIVAEVQAMAGELSGRLEPPHLRWKYAWMRPAFGWKVAKWAQRTLPYYRAALVGQWDKAMYKMDGSDTSTTRGRGRMTAAEIG